MVTGQVKSHVHVHVLLSSKVVMDLPCYVVLHAY